MQNLSYEEKWLIASGNLKKRGIYGRMARYGEVSQTDNVIDLCCGNCEFIKELCKKHDLSSSVIVGIDYSKKLLEVGRKNLERSGYDVNFVYNPADRHFRVSRTSLRKGINLIGDLCGSSDYRYLSRYEFDGVFLTFLGGAPPQVVEINEILARTMDDMGAFMRRNGKFIYIDRALSHPKATRIPQKLSELSRKLKLEHSEFFHSPEDYVTSLYPLRSFIQLVVTENYKAIGARHIEFDHSKSTFEETVEEIIQLERESGLEFGIEYSKFRKV
jgi:SAM-dependent methyltransferase